MGDLIISLDRTPVVGLPHRDYPSLAPTSDEPHWYAAYTRHNHERTAVSHFGQRSVESWLPTYEAIRQWKDRRVRVRFPLFPGYIFVRIALKERLKVLEVPGIVRLVGFRGSPTPLTEQDISAVRKASNCTHRQVKPCAYVSSGAHVRIIGGPFQGMQGVVVRKKGNLRVVVSLELIQSSFTVEVNQTEICSAPPVIPKGGR